MFDISKATEEQKQVLFEKDKNILVSAAAGSGKTTVMIEKIVRMILEQKISIENFLVLTFTKASAEDMKNKLISRLSCEEMSPFVLEQIDNIPVSDVSNLHSFCARLLKNYFYVIGLDPTFSVVDELEQKKLKAKALDRLFESEIKADNSLFFEVSDIFQRDRKDDKLKEQILKIYEFSKSQYDFDAWKKANIESTFEPDLNKNKCAEIIKNYAKNIAFVYKNEINELKELIIQNVDEDNSKKLCVYLDSLDTKLSSIKFNDRFEIFSDSVKTLGKYDSIPKVDEQFEEYKKLCMQMKKDMQKRIETIVNALFADADSTIETITEALQNIKKHVEFLYGLAKRFDEIYLMLKKEQGVLDFNDLEAFALEVLSNPEILAEIKQRYKYIFVDEYQDINSVQEKIITMISSDNNRFMVGDIKQSIYGFRLCDPEIFLNKYNEYKNGETKSVSISLNKNFRSFPDILEFVNIVFDNTMTKSFGGVDYKAEARLIPGKVVENNTQARATLMFVDTTGIKGSDNQPLPELPVYSVKNHQYLDTIENEKAHLEGMVIANKIAEIVGSNKYTIIDKETKKERQITYKDIVLLVHSRNEYLNDLLDVLDGVGIPVSSDITSDVFDDADIISLKNMLFVVSNFACDKALFSLMYSRFFKFSPDELLEIRQSSDHYYFYECVLNYPYKDTDLYLKITNFIQTIEVYKKLSSFMMVGDLCGKIIRDFSIEQNMISSGNSSERLAKLNKFLSSLSNCTLEEFLMNNDLSNLECECKTLPNSVRVMTIHKSKGLEFPVVFLIGTGRDFNRKSVYGDMFMSKELGMTMNFFNTNERYKTLSLARAASKIVENKKFFEEEQRLLYVALTRAIDYLFVTGCGEMGALKAKFQPTPTCFLEWFAPLLLDENYKNSTVFDTEYYDISNIEKWDKNKQDRPVLLGKINTQTKAMLENQLAYVYPFETQTLLPRKTTITKIANADNVFVDEERSFDARITSSAERGTAYHKVFENLTLLENSLLEIEGVIARLKNRKVLTDEEIQMIDTKKILNCISNTKLREIILQSSWIKKEVEFFMLVGEGDRKDQTEVQGIIDMLVKVGDCLVLYDYKTGNLTQNTARAKYSVQLEGYKQAAERIFGAKVVKMCIVAVDMGEIFEI